MSETRFSAFQNSIDEKYLNEAARGSVRKKRPWLGAVAACLCVALIGAVALKSGVFNAKSAAPAGAPAVAYEDACEEESVLCADTAASGAMEAPAAPVPAPDAPAEFAAKAEEECAEAPANDFDEAYADEIYGCEIPDDSFNLPEGASLMLSDGNKVFEGCRLYEACFTLDDAVYVLRIAATPGVTLTDISGATAEFAEESEGRVSYCPSVLHWNEGEDGYICWYDVVPGISYALYTDRNASEASLTEMAETVFRPMQGDA